MYKRGLSVLGLIIVIIFIGVIVSLATYFILDKGTEAEEGIPKGMGDVNASANQTVSIEITKCSDYENQIDCESDSYDISIPGHPQWDTLGCDNPEVECKCVWDATSASCSLINETIDQTEEIVLDVAAISLTLENAGCKDVNITEGGENITVKECDLNIRGVVKNVGSITIETDFSIHFLDITSGTSLIESIIISESIAPEEEKEIIAKYDDIPPGDYWIKFRVDPSFKLDEADEVNNDITEFIKVL